MLSSGSRTKISTRRSGFWWEPLMKATTLRPVSSATSLVISSLSTRPMGGSLSGVAGEELHDPTGDARQQLSSAGALFGRLRYRQRHLLFPQATSHAISHRYTTFRRDREGRAPDRQSRPARARDARRPGGRPPIRPKRACAAEGTRGTLAQRSDPRALARG